MLASWGLLSYIKAADTRQNASFAVNHNVRVQRSPEAAGYKKVVRPPDDLSFPYNSTDSGVSSVTHRINRDQERTADPFSSDSLQRNSFLQEMSLEESLTEEDRQTIMKNEQEIDDFLRQFEQADAEDAASGDDIDAFLRELELSDADSERRPD